MKTLYFDCFSGISGDMTIGALLDVGVDFEYLKTEIGKLPVDGFELRLTRVVRASINSAKFDVIVDGDSGHPHQHSHDHSNDHAHDHSHEHGESHHDAAAGSDDGGHTHFHRKASEIMDMIRQSALAAGVRTRAIDIFEQLAISEGQVHDLPPEEVEFHEVGAIDSIVDIVGTAIGLEALDVEHFECSPINIGGGFIHCQHGVYPVPAPATANLLTEAEVYSKHVDRELVTPTGAAILAATIDNFGPMDAFTIEKVGYGAGTADLGEFPNCLRLFVGTVRPLEEPTRSDRVMVIEANIDDMSAEQMAYSAEKLMSSGAIDVVTIPVLMKKGRPGHILQVLAEPTDIDMISRLMFEETTTIGVRMRPADRRVLDREVVKVQTVGGTIRVKIGRFEGRVLTVSPEYDDCARVAQETNRPFHEVRDDAVQSYRDATTNR